jgi:hypothetical protein
MGHCPWHLCISGELSAKAHCASSLAALGDLYDFGDWLQDPVEQPRKMARKALKP